MCIPDRPSPAGPDFPPAPESDVPRLLAESFRHFHRGRQADALRDCDEALASTPRDPQALHLRGLILQAEGKLEEAERSIAEAIRHAPHIAEYYNNLGVVFRGLNSLSRAAACHRKALELNPGLAGAADNLSAVSRLLKRFPEAVVYARQAIELAPDLAGPRFNLALAFHAQGMLKQAVECYRELTARHPDHAAGFFNLGVALFDLGRVDEAAAAYERALAIRPDYPEALNGLAVAKRIRSEFEEAVALTRRATRLRSDFPEAVSHLAVLGRLTCAWEELPRLDERLAVLSAKALAAGEKTAEQPMYSLWCGRPPEIQRAVAASWSRAMGFAAAPKEAPASAGRREVLNIGYVSSDFRNHPVSHQLLGVLRRRDRRQFAVHAYSIGPDDGSRFRREIEECCERFADLTGLTDAAAAARIAADAIDVLVDLNGHTAGNRMGIFARRPAPIQTSFLGYPGTTGSDFHDYLITDRVVTPPDQQRFYSETFVYLPRCYMPTDDSQPISPADFRRGKFGLSEEQFVLCSFNNFWKIDPVLFDAWMSLLRDIPRAVLWLAGGNRPAAENLTREAARRGVPAGRLVFAEKLQSKADHLARLALADLALDTRIYNGHVSTCDALWAGVPVVALKGTTYASRASASMLRSAGLPGLVAESLEDYRQIALQLSEQPSALGELRACLSGNRFRAPLFDSRGYTKSLEAAYLAMVENHLAGAHAGPLEILPT